MSDRSMTAPGGPVPTEPNTDQPQPIDGARALQLLREVVSERPDYIYKKPGSWCVYAHEGQPSCLVGQVLHRAGVPAERLEGFSGDIVMVSELDIPGLLQRDATQILMDAQAVQDPGEEPWSAALAAAELKAVELGVSA